MSYSNNDSFGLCKQCFKQQQFCTCQEGKEYIDQTFSENNPQIQSMGEQDQHQHQEQGPQDQKQNQEQGPQTQDQVQEGQSQGPQTQKQHQGPQTQGNQTEDQDQTQGSQTQNQTEDQDQTQGSQSQNQTEDQDQIQGAQLQTQSHGDQIMTNDQTISTPINVEGVKLDVKCGDCKPTIIITDKFIEKHKNHCEHGGEFMEECSCKEINRKNSRNECDCCVQNLGELLKKVQKFQSTLSSATDKAVDIYFSSVNGLVNPTEGQVITSVINCSVLKFKNADQTTVVPNSTVQLCDVAGICATDTDDTVEISNVFEFLLDQANANSEDVSSNCKNKMQPCKCSSCASGIGNELLCTANFGLLLDVFIKGQTSALPFYVLTVKDCLVYFVDNINLPTEICVFSLCAISGFSVVSQMI